MSRSITVIGAGLVGVCCALHLQREGFKVRLVEKGEPGKAASFGNSGSFGTASCVPFALPGVLVDAVAHHQRRRMADPDRDSPFRPQLFGPDLRRDEARDDAVAAGAAPLRPVLR